MWRDSCCSYKDDETMSFRTPPIAALSLLVALTACSGGATHLSPTAPAAGQHLKHPQDTLGGVGGRMDIQLTDAPPQLGGITPTEIDLGVDKVAVVSNGQSYTIAQYSTPDIVNVLAQQNGNGASIGIGQYFSGAYQAVQFTFDVASSKVVAGTTSYPIMFLPNNDARSSAGAGGTTTTSATATSVTVTVTGNFTIGSDPAASIQADYNLLESLAMNSSGQIVSRPTLFASAYSAAGKADGIVTNSSGAPVANATVVAIDANGNVANTTSTDSTGAYDLHTLYAGQYQIEVYNSYTTTTGQTVTATGNSNTAPSINGPSVTVTDQETTQAPVIQD